jgi:hypothetical protein
LEKIIKHDVCFSPDFRNRTPSPPSKISDWKRISNPSQARYSTNGAQVNGWLISKKGNHVGGSHSQARALHSGKPTGYEKTIEHTRRQGPQSSCGRRQRAGALLLRAVASGVRRASVSGLRVIRSESTERSAVFLAAPSSVGYYWHLADDVKNRSTNLVQAFGSSAN